MKELESILKDHALRYPLMGPTDAVKLIFQNEFAGGHMIRSKEKAMDFLLREYAETPRNPTAELYEDIGNGVVRVNLAALREEDLMSLGEEFISSSEAHTGSLERFLEKLELLRSLTEQGVFGFHSDELSAYLDSCRSAGYPAVSHSEAYRKAYSPAYRVVRRRPLNDCFEAVCAAIDSRLKTGSRQIIAIDGRCASGKSTLAARLRHRFGCTVIPMDHFFLQPHQRTPQRLDTPGENVDHERFLKEVLLPLRAGTAFDYRPFDCGIQAMGAPVPVPESRLTIVEGSYSCHRALWDLYDLRIFLTVDPGQQMRRILRRNGPEMAEIFRRRWIPLEEKYFASAGLSQRCDLSFDTSL